MMIIDQLSFSYRKQQVLNQLSLSLGPGHIYGLMGSNGTGKSTLLKNLAGSLFPQKGRVDVFGYKPGDRKPKFLQQLFLLPEEFYLPGITIKALLKGLAPFYPSFSQNDFYKYLFEFEVPTDRSIDEMSYGQKKKTLISFGLACNTKLLLLDEPTNGLDILSKSQFRKVLAGTIDPTRYIIISTHQVKDLENLIDHVVILQNGKVAFDQTMQNIAQKLSFKTAQAEEDWKLALYADKEMRGSPIITINDSDEESTVDLELLYKSVVLSNHTITKQFN